MYVVHNKLDKSLTHIVAPEDRNKFIDELIETGDTLCMALSGVRKDGKKFGRRWSLQSSPSNVMCKNCLLIESKWNKSLSSIKV